MIIYETALKFSCSLFKENINPFLFPKVRHTKLDLGYLNPPIIDHFDNLNLDIVLVEVFYSKPFYRSGIHIDSTGGDINKINWVYGGTNCLMNWYSIKNPSIKKDLANTVIKTKAQHFTPLEVNKKYSTVLSSPSLVHVGLPHNVHNDYEDRWCVSLVYRFKDSEKRPTMKESLDIFKKFI